MLSLFSLHPKLCWSWITSLIRNGNISPISTLVMHKLSSAAELVIKGKGSQSIQTHWASDLLHRRLGQDCSAQMTDWLTVSNAVCVFLSEPCGNI